MQIIDGKKVSAQVKEEVKRQTLELKETHKITPGLAVVIVGDDPASRVYVNNKKKACQPRASTPRSTPCPPPPPKRSCWT